MTIVNHDTGEIVETLTKADARRLTDRIRLLAETVADQVEKMAGLIDEARVGSAWLALGYASWTAYVSQEFGGVLPRLEREPRQEFVRELAARGMSTRAIAPVVGANHSTVVRDLNTGGADAPPARAPQGEGSPSLPSTVETAEPTSPSSPRPAVTGMDGKVYSLPPRRPVLQVAPEPVAYDDQDHAEELAKNLSRNLSLLYAVTNPERRAEYIKTWRDGTKEVQPLGSDFITPEHMRTLASALATFADEWESADV